MINRIMLKKMANFIYAVPALLVLAGFSAAPVQAQMVDLQEDNSAGTATVVQEHRSKSNWERPLVDKDPNLKHFYWTEVDRNKAAYKVINRAGAHYQTVRTAVSSKPNVVHVRSTKNIFGDYHGDNGDVSGRVRPQELAQSNTAATYSYGYGDTYGKVNVAPASYGSSSQKQVKAKVLY